MGRALIVIRGNAERERAAHWAMKAPFGTRIEYKASKRSLPQNDRMWAMLTDVAQQLEWHGLRLLPEDWKFIFLDALKRDVRAVPNIDGNGFVNLGRSSSDLSKDEMSDLMEIISEFGARHGVTFQDTESEPEGVSPEPGSEGSGISSAADPSPPSDPVPQTPADGGDTDSPQEPAPEGAPALPSDDMAEMKRDCMEKFLSIATDPALDVQEKRATIEGARDPWKAELPDDLEFVKACMQTADKVAKGELKPDAAKKYLEGLL